MNKLLLLVSLTFSFVSIAVATSTEGETSTEDCVMMAESTYRGSMKLDLEGLKPETDYSASEASIQ